jgi:crotonobetainyl-CoA:carnitine CoA-transferase CaiB-like acyl-CoA transferase
VLVENYRPTVMPRAGLGFEALREVNPWLIYAQLSVSAKTDLIPGAAAFT